MKPTVNGVYDKDPRTEEPDEVKISRPVRSGGGVGDRLSVISYKRLHQEWLAMSGVNRIYYFPRRTA